jgi:hypothetical protein
LVRIRRRGLPTEGAEPRQHAKVVTNLSKSSNTHRGILDGTLSDSSTAPLRLEAFNLGREQANSLVRRFHRHHGPVTGFKFAIGLRRGTEIVGVVIAGRPVARLLDDGATLEITRLAVKDGVPNACSKLYGHAVRAGRALGFDSIVTYTLAEEPGTSLRAAGFRHAGESGGGSWTRPSRKREDGHPLGPKVRWELTFNSRSRPVGGLPSVRSDALGGSSPFDLTEASPPEQPA